MCGPLQATNDCKLAAFMKFSKAGACDMVSSICKKVLMMISPCVVPVLVQHLNLAGFLFCNPQYKPTRWL